MRNHHPIAVSHSKTASEKRLKGQAGSAARRAECTQSIGGTDEKLLRDVDAICVTCGEQARSLLLSDSPYLTQEILARIKHSSPERQKFEIEQMRQGIRPFSKKSTVLDTKNYGEVISRLARAAVRSTKPHKP